MKPIKVVAHLPGNASINPGGRTTGKHTPPVQSPAERAAEVAKASEAGKGIEGLGHKVDKFVAASEKRNKKAAQAKARAERSWVPSTKELERVTGGNLVANVSLPTPKVRHPHLDTGVVQAGFGPTGDKVPKPPKVKGPEDTPEVRPDVPELNAGHSQSKTSYREPPKKPKPDSRGVPSIGMGAPKHYRWSPAGHAKSPQDRTLADLVVPGVRSGTSGVGSKPSHLPNFSTAGTSRYNKPPTRSSSAGVAERGAVGKEGSEKRDIKDRNIDKPEKKLESILKNNLFGENTMNPDKIANDIIREAFTSGDRKNTTPNDNSMEQPGGTQRQMLAGEFFGSVAWPFDQSSNDMYDGSAELQASQAQSGMGNGQGDGFQEGVAREIVDNLLEDSPSAIYSDTESVGYLLNEMDESGYKEEAAVLRTICEDAKEEDVVKVVTIIEKMEAEKADPFLIEQLARFANLLIEDDQMATSDSNPSDPNLDKEDAGSETDNNSTGVEP